MRAVSADSVFGGGGTGKAVSNGTIEGPFTIAVDAVKEAYDLTIENAIHGINVDSTNVKIQRNTILNATMTGITATLGNGASFVDSNYIGMSPNGVGVGILVTGVTSGTAPRVDDNFLVEFNVGVSANNTTKLRIRRNVLASAASNIATGMDVNSTNKTLTDNVCSHTVADVTHCGLDNPFSGLP